MSLPVADIVVGDRARKDNGCMIMLCSSIEELGLLHPIVVNSRYELVAGGRRLAAVKEMRWTEVLCHVVDTLDDAVLALKAERDENKARKELTPSELVEIGRKLEEIERPKAAERKRAGQERGARSPKGERKLPRDVQGKHEGETLTQVAKGVSEITGQHTSPDSLRKFNKIEEAATADPEKYGDLRDEMNTTGKAEPAYRKLRERQRAADPDTTPKKVTLLDKLRRDPELCGLIRAHKSALGNDLFRFPADVVDVIESTPTLETPK